MREKRPYIPWTEDEVARMKAIGVRDDWTALAPQFAPHSLFSVKGMASKLGLILPRSGYERWTGKELETLAEKWPNSARREIEWAIKQHSWQSIQQQARKLGVRRKFDRSHARSGHAVINALAARRKELGVTRAQLGKKVGYHAVHIAKWERGELFPRFLSLLNWCDALGVELSVATKNES